MLSPDERSQVVEIYTAFTEEPEDSGDLGVLVNASIATFAEVGLSNEVLAEVLFSNAVIYRQILNPSRPDFDPESGSNVDNVLINLVTISLLAAGKLLVEEDAQDTALIAAMLTSFTAEADSSPLAE